MKDKDSLITYYPPNQKISSVLGMVWDKEKDALGYDPLPELPTLFTKSPCYPWYRRSLIQWGT